ncbi:SapC family protein [Algibacillus agarilyticus]|uniref:SapC family protein n=1 Tax=Algibacillus agarilyticus TaxID=2234133 RepID=UPI000DCF708F|nr:SapC family protein [Algibacillus agarilyticus]
MTQFTMLDKETHRNTRIITDRGAQYGENIHLVPVIADELATLILEYPVCLIKSNETGQFGLQALLGFEAEENLYLDGDTWHANYLPLHIRRQPFMVAVKGAEGEQPTPENTLITLNTHNPRVQEQTGERLFDEQGECTPFMNSINDMLATVVSGMISTESFIKTLTTYDLIEQVHLNVSFVGGEQKRFDGIYTINETKLQQLTPQQLSELNSKGYLQACYLLLASMGHVQKLITLKRKRLSNA